MTTAVLSPFAQTIANMDSVQISDMETQPNYTQYNLVDKLSQQWLGWVREIGGNATSVRAYCATGANGSSGLWVSLDPEEYEIDAYGDEHRPLVVPNEDELKKEVMLFVARWSARFVPEEV